MIFCDSFSAFRPKIHNWHNCYDFNCYDFSGGGGGGGVDGRNEDAGSSGGRKSRPFLFECPVATGRNRPPSDDATVPFTFFNRLHRWRRRSRPITVKAAQDHQSTRSNGAFYWMPKSSILPLSDTPRLPMEEIHHSVQWADAIHSTPSLRNKKKRKRKEKERKKERGTSWHRRRFTTSNGEKIKHFKMTPTGKVPILPLFL